MINEHVVFAFSEKDPVKNLILYTNNVSRSKNWNNGTFIGQINKHNFDSTIKRRRNVFRSFITKVKWNYFCLKI